MEFWGVEVKPGQPFKVMTGDGMVLHLSQAVLGETKKGKGSEPVFLSVNLDEKKLVLGTLYAKKLPQVQFDLVFEKDFELTHNWKHGSVYFYGYKAPNPFDEVKDSDFDTDSDEEVPPTLVNNVKQEAKPKLEKPAEVEKSNVAKDKESGSDKKKVKIVEPSKDSSDEDDDSSDEELSEDSGESEDSDEDESEDDDDSDTSNDSDEETPQKVEVSKKRAAESASKTPLADKKAKVTPQKTDGKKVSSHVATPHPAKQTGKTPASKPSQQTPKSAGTHTCSSCNKGFGSDKALESHTKAKHGGN